MENLKSKALAFVVSSLICVAPTVSAEVISEFSPYASKPFGQQSDSNTPAYFQSVTGAALANLTSITWWGYHGVDSAGSANDDFDVVLNGSLLIGALSTDSSDPMVSRYTLAISPWLGTASLISIVNQGIDVEWYWQSAATFGGAHATDVAYQFEGTPYAVPEPTASLLLLASFSLLAVVERRRPRDLG